MLANYLLVGSYSRKPEKVYFHVLTHSSLSVRIGVDLTIVLDDRQAGRDGGHHFILTVLRAGAAGRLLAAAVIAIKHPERVSPLSL